MNNDINSVALSYRIGSVATNAVKAIREVYGRDGQPYLDADTAAIKAIEAILTDMPHQSQYDAYEAKPLVASAQPSAHPALEKITKMLADDLEHKVAA